MELGMDIINDFDAYAQNILISGSMDQRTMINAMYMKFKSINILRIIHIAHKMPTMSLFHCENLHQYNLISNQNYSEVFQDMINLGLTPDDMKLIREEDGTIGFALKLSGIKKFAEHNQKMKLALDVYNYFISSIE